MCYEEGVLDFETKGARRIKDTNNYATEDT
jgi:hypothetical protein